MKKKLVFVKDLTTFPYIITWDIISDMNESQEAKVSAEIPWSDGNEEDFSDLHEAIASGKTSLTNYEAPDDSGSTSEEDETEPDVSQPGVRLLWAAQFNRLDILSEILESQPDLIKFTDDDGYTALHRAAYSSSKECLVALLMSGADISATTADVWTPLHSACRWNRANCAEILLNWGADVNKVTQGGQTPLHLAAFCAKSTDTLQLLLLNPKIKAMAKNCQGDTPVDIARRNGNPVDMFDLVLPAFCDSKP